MQNLGAAGEQNTDPSVAAAVGAARSPQRTALIARVETALGLTLEPGQRTILFDWWCCVLDATAVPGAGKTTPPAPRRSQRETKKTKRGDYQ